MEPTTEKTAFKAPPIQNPIKNGAVKPVQQPDKKSDPNELAGFWDQVMKHDSTNKIKDFLFNPFIFVGGLIAAVYFLIKGKKEDALREQENAELRSEVERLRKKNKKLKARLESLSGDSEDEEGTPTGKTQLRLPGSNHKPQTFYLE